MRQKPITLTQIIRLRRRLLLEMIFDLKHAGQILGGTKELATIIRQRKRQIRPN